MIRQLTHLPRWSIALLALAALLATASCDDDKKKKKKGGGGAAVEQPIVQPGVQPDDGAGGGGSDTGGAVVLDPIAVPERPTEDQVTTTQPASFALVRLTPEQMSKKLEDTLNVQATYYNQFTGRTENYLETLFAVGLGGVDFVAASRRDPSTKAQTVLIARVLAWFGARAVVFADSSRPANEQLFRECDPWADRPFYGADSMAGSAVQDAIRAGEARWELCVNDLFWRLFARPPAASELAAVRSAFIVGLQNEPNVPTTSTNIPWAWSLVTYALISTQEFWHL